MEGHTLSYLAGVFDGEGCVHSSYSKDEKRALMFIRINMTYQPILEKFHDLFGGSLRSHTDSGNSKATKVIWTWTLGPKSGDLSGFLQTMLDYGCMEKRSQLLLAQEFRTADQAERVELAKAIRHEKTANYTLIGDVT